MTDKLQKMLMDSYDAGVADAREAAIEALEVVVKKAVKEEREACAKVCEAMADKQFRQAAMRIRARGDVHASDISQERVDETAKRKHEWVGLDGDIPGLGLVTEEFYNGMLCAEDILRKKNT